MFQIDRSERHGGETTNQLRIKPITQDSEGSERCGSEEAAPTRMIQEARSNYFGGLVLLEIVPACLVVLLPLSVHAGVFSSLFNLAADVAPAAQVHATAERASDVRLLSANNIPDRKQALGGGDIIVEGGALVPGGVIGEDLFAESQYQSGEISVYTVREGDTLSQVAEMFGVTSNTILWANDIASATTIQPGDTLVILPIVGVRHVVKSGDTISTIAKKYDGDADEIIAYNQLASVDAIAVGDIVVVPGGNMHQATPKRSRGTVAPTKVTGVVATTNFTHPVPGSIRTQGIHGYNAVDLAAPVGTPIRAAASGEVIVSKQGGWNGGYGNYLVIRHGNGSQTLYAHNSRNIVGVGAFVGAGETVAYVGNTGRSTGAHLHFEVRGARNPF